MSITDFGNGPVDIRPPSLARPAITPPLPRPRPHLPSTQTPSLPDFSSLASDRAPMRPDFSSLARENPPSPIEKAGTGLMDMAAKVAKDTTAATQAVGQIADAVKQGFGTDSLITGESNPLPLNGKAIKTLDAMGVFGPSLLQQINEAGISFAVASGNALARTWPAFTNGVHETVKQVAMGAGADKSHATDLADQVAGFLDFYVTSRMAGMEGIPGRAPGSRPSDLGVLPKETRDFLKEAQRTKPQTSQEKARARFGEWMQSLQEQPQLPAPGAVVGAARRGEGPAGATATVEPPPAGPAPPAPEAAPIRPGEPPAAPGGVPMRPEPSAGAVAPTVESTVADAHQKALASGMSEADWQRLQPDVQRGAEAAIAAQNQKAIPAPPPAPQAALPAPRAVAKAPAARATPPVINLPDFSAQASAAGSRAAPIAVASPQDAAMAAEVAATDYTAAQGEANNRQLGHVTWNGLDGSIEVPAGGTRKGLIPGTDRSWSTRHTVPYGYWKGTMGADGMHVDAYFGPEMDAGHPAYVLKELDPETGKFRQNKTFVGFPSEDAARAAYLGTSSKTANMIGGITAMPVDKFKAWVESPAAAKPLASTPPAAKPETSPVKESVSAGRPMPPSAAPVGRPTKTAKVRKPKSLTQFLAGIGGIKDQNGELSRGLDIGRHFVPGYGRLVRKNGVSLDYAREAAAEAGYLGGDKQRALAETTPADLLDAIDQEINRSQPVYSSENQQQLADYQAQHTSAADEAAKARLTDEVTTALDEGGGDTSDTRYIETVTDMLYTGEAANMDAAFERAAIVLADEQLSEADQNAIDQELLRSFAEEPQPAGNTGGGGRGQPVETQGQGQAPAGADANRATASVRGATEGGTPTEVGAKLDDIPYREAYDAYRNMSMDPDKRAAQVRQEYVDEIYSLRDEMMKRATTDAQKAIVTEEVAKYRQRYLTQYRDILRARSRTASPMVTGPARFPTARNQKALDAEQKKVESFLDWRKRARNAIERRIAGARTGEQVVSDQWTLLKKSIDQDLQFIREADAGQKGYDRRLFRDSIARALRTRAKNGHVELVQKALDYIAKAQEGMAKPIFPAGRASIWQLASEAREVTATPEQTGVVEHTAFDGGRTVLNHDADRVQILFEQKPDETMRQALRKEGWKWSPRESAWQRQLTDNAIRSADRITGATPAVPRGVGATSEIGAEGKPQTVLPGAERISSADLAKRKATEPLKPKAEQKPADQGLFSDQAAQTDLVDMARQAPKRMGSTVEQAPTFYSAVLRAAEGAKIAKGTPEQWLATIRNTPGVKAEELDWIGLEPWLKEQTGTVTKEQVADFIRANQIEVRDVVKGASDVAIEEAKAFLRKKYGEDPEQRYGYSNPTDYVDLAIEEGARITAPYNDSTKFASYQLPGGTSYRELLLTLPVDSAETRTIGNQIADLNRSLRERYGDRWRTEAPREALPDINKLQKLEDRLDALVGQDQRGAYRSPHFDEPNVVAHVRFNDRTDAAGKRTLFIEEVQSDWHQKGRKRGYQSERPKVDVKTDEKGGRQVYVNGTEYAYFRANQSPMLDGHSVSMEDYLDALKVRPDPSSVPDAPFKTTWPELALKRMIRYAAENGYDQIGWTPGIEQVKRYEAPLRQQVRAIEWSEYAGKPGWKTIEVFGGRSGLSVTIDDRGVIKSALGADGQAMTEKTVEDLVGKDIGRRIMEKPTGRVEGNNLTIGGKGMQDFYDRILVNTANKLGKKFGAKVGLTRIEGTRNAPDLKYDIEAAGNGRWRIVLTGGERPTYMPDAPTFASGAEAETWLADNGYLGADVHALPITPEMRASVLRGQPLFSLAENRVASQVRPDIPAAKRARIERQASEIVSRIAGKNVAVRFENRISTTETLTPAQLTELRAAAQSRGRVLKETAAGYYQLDGAPLIGLALGDPTYTAADTITAAGHEAWHHVEMALLNAGEHDAIARDMPRIRAYAEQERPVSGLPDYEVTAYAFQRYRRLKEEGAGTGGLAAAVRRIFDKIAAVLRAIRNMLKREKITKFEDIFERARTGEIARRAEEPTNEPPVRMGSTAETPAERASAVNFQSRQIAKRFSSVMSAADKARVKLEDDALPLKRVQERIEAEAGVRLSTNLNAYLARSLYKGRAGERLIDLRNHHVDPLIKAMRQAGVNLDQLGNYLYARHAQERNAVIREINPENDAGSGMTDAEARKILQTVNSKPARAEVYRSLAARVDAITEFARNTLHGGGLLSDEQLDAWRNQYAHYVPLRGFEAAPEEAMPRSGRGFDIRGPEAYQAMGRRSRADNPVIYAISQAEQAIVRREKNRVGAAVLRLAQTYPDPAVWQVAKAVMKRRVNPSTGLVETYAIQPAFSRSEDLFAVKIHGQTRWIEVTDPALARVLRGTGAEFSNPILKGLMSVSRGYAAMQTSFNPEFVLRNPIKDMQEALINISDTPGLPAGTRRKLLTDAVTLKSARVIVHAIYNPEARGDYEQWFHEFRLAGGKVSFIDLNDVQRIKARIDKNLRRGNMQHALLEAAEVVEHINAAMENATRLSAYIALRKGGVSRDEAAFAARNLTVDFNKRGEWGPYINSAYVFWNAGVQGTARMAKALYRSKLARRAALGLIAFGAALDLLNSLMATDDNDRNRYDAIKPWIRQNNIILMFPGDDRGRYIMIPKSYGYGVFVTAGEEAMRMARGAETPAQAIATTAASAINSFNPFGSTPSLMQLLSPTVVDPFAQVAENKTWYGGPVYPRVFDDRKPLSESYFATTPGWAVKLAKTLNSMTGGNIGKSGWLDVSPNVIEHFANFVAGGAGATLQRMGGTVQHIIAGDEFTPSNIPFLRTFFGMQTNASRLGDFYDMWGKIDAARYEVRQLQKVGDEAGARAAEKRNAAEIRAYGAFYAASKQLKNIRDQRARPGSDHAAFDMKERAIIDRAFAAYKGK